MRRMITLFLILVLSASSLIMIKPAEAQISPSVPEFSLKLEDHSYDVAPTYTTDPNTGIVNATGGYHVEKRFIDVIIKNPTPYSFYAVVNESVVKLYYSIRVKGYSQDWTYATNSSNLAPSTTEYTTVKFGIGSVNPDPGGWSIWLGDITTGSQLDFQVQGVNGFYTNSTEETSPCWRLPDYNIFNETGRSAWSDTQTITIPDGSTSQPATSTPTGTPSTQTTTAPTSTANFITSLADGFTPVILTVSIVVITLAVSIGALIYREKRGKRYQP
jgi:hypothetical protein